MTTADSVQNTANIVVEGGVTATAIAFFSDSLREMIPFLIIAIPLIALDLDWGIKAAKHRRERLKFSKAFRGTFGKIFEYIAWCVLAATAAVAFGHKWIEYVVIGAVYINELASIVGNYLETKNIDFGIVELWKILIRKISGKVGVEVSEEEVNAVIRPRNSKGQFTKKI